MRALLRRRGRTLLLPPPAPAGGCGGGSGAYGQAAPVQLRSERIGSRACLNASQLWPWALACAEQAARGAAAWAPAWGHGSAVSSVRHPAPCLPQLAAFLPHSPDLPASGLSSTGRSKLRTRLHACRRDCSMAGFVFCQPKLLPAPTGVEERWGPGGCGSALLTTTLQGRERRWEQRPGLDRPACRTRNWGCRGERRGNMSAAATRSTGSMATPGGGRQSWRLVGLQTQEGGTPKCSGLGLPDGPARQARVRQAGRDPTAAVPVPLVWGLLRHPPWPLTVLLPFATNEPAAEIRQLVLPKCMPMQEKRELLTVNTL